MKVLVTGAAGFIGSQLATRLCQLGHSVIGVDNFDPYYARDDKERNAAEARNLGMDLLERDLAADDMRDTLADCDAIYHCAAQPGISDTTRFDAYVRNNVVATQMLVDAAIRAGDDRTRRPFFINVSTSSVYGSDATGPETTEPKPTSFYGVTKLAAEQLALAPQRRGLIRACSLRLFSVYGPRERPEKLFPRLIRAIARDREFPLYDGARAHTRSFTYVGDIIEAFVRALTHQERIDGEVINIGSGIRTSTGEAIDIVESIMGRKARFQVLPPRIGDQQDTCADIAKARRLLGYEPSVVPSEGLKESVRWFGAGQ